jgi:hypothetical protein
MARLRERSGRKAKELVAEGLALDRPEQRGVSARVGRELDAERLQRLIAAELEEPAVRDEWGPAERPGHSTTGRVVTDIEPDWSRYDDCKRIDVVGESFYQQALLEVTGCEGSGSFGYECSAEMVLDPENPHDKFAVRVEVEGKLVGHLKRGTARNINKRLRELKADGGHAICMAYVGRGSDSPNLGVVLHVPYDCAILQGRS